jgi:hypothetical protein
MLPPLLRPVIENISLLFMVFDPQSDGMLNAKITGDYGASGY